MCNPKLPRPPQTKLVRNRKTILRLSRTADHIQLIVTTWHGFSSKRNSPLMRACPSFLGAEASGDTGHPGAGQQRRRTVDRRFRSAPQTQPPVMIRHSSGRSHNAEMYAKSRRAPEGPVLDSTVSGDHQRVAFLPERRRAASGLTPRVRWPPTTTGLPNLARRTQNEGIHTPDLQAVQRSTDDGDEQSENDFAPVSGQIAIGAGFVRGRGSAAGYPG